MILGKTQEQKFRQQQTKRARDIVGRRRFAFIPMPLGRGTWGEGRWVWLETYYTVCVPHSWDRLVNVDGYINGQIADPKRMTKAEYAEYQYRPEALVPMRSHDEDTLSIARLGGIARNYAKWEEKKKWEESL